MSVRGLHGAAGSMVAAFNDPVLTRVIQRAVDQNLTSRLDRPRFPGARGGRPPPAHSSHLRLIIRSGSGLRQSADGSLGSIARNFRATRAISGTTTWAPTAAGNSICSGDCTRCPGGARRGAGRRGPSGSARASASVPSPPMRTSGSRDQSRTSKTPCRTGADRVAYARTGRRGDLLARAQELSQQILCVGL